MFPSANIVVGFQPGFNAIKALSSEQGVDDGSQPQTTARYAHLAANPMMEASEHIGKQIAAHF